MSATTWLPNYAQITYEDLRVVVMDAPAEGYEQNWVDVLMKHGVKVVVCTAESGQYWKKSFNENGIEVVDLIFADGTEPPEKVVHEWLQLVRRGIDEKFTLAVHCLAGLGRAPALVAIALMELGMDATDSILHVRESRRGAISARQVKFLQEYKPRGVLKKRKGFCCF